VRVEYCTQQSNAPHKLTLIFPSNLALSDEERVLFRELIKVCDKKINPGLLKIKWNTDVSERYISDCFLCISEVRIKFSYIDNLLFSSYHGGSNVCHPHCVYQYVPIKTVSPYMVLY